jgi:hypothetical protein
LFQARYEIHELNILDSFTCDRDTMQDLVEKNRMKLRKEKKNHEGENTTREEHVKKEKKEK